MESDDILTTVGDQGITVGDMRRLVDGGWVGETIINSYIQLINARAKRVTSVWAAGVWAASSHLYPNIKKCAESGEGWENVLAWDPSVSPVHTHIDFL
jgi:Ulp1 family protease